VGPREDGTGSGIEYYCCVLLPLVKRRAQSSPVTPVKKFENKGFLKKFVEVIFKLTHATQATLTLQHYNTGNM
jgi:hypothetical protein